MDTLLPRPYATGLGRMITTVEEHTAEADQDFYNKFTVYLYCTYGLTLPRDQRWAIRRLGEYGTENFRACKLTLRYPRRGYAVSRWATAETTLHYREPFTWRAVHNFHEIAHPDHSYAYILTTHPLAAILYACYGLKEE